MGKSIGVVTNDVVRVAEDLIAEHHPDLADANLRIGYAFVASDKGLALKHHGVPAAAIVSLVSPELRVVGAPDILIRVDANIWARLQDEPRRALLDHELTHVQLVIDEETGEPEIDAAGRPKARLRPHDYDLGIFRSIIDRYGLACIDALHVARIAKEAGGQLIMPFMNESTELPELTRSAVEAAEESERAQAEAREKARLVRITGKKSGRKAASAV